jgi:flagellar motility protein MotE (MotC chaperone)
MKKIIFLLLLVLSSQVGCTLTDPEMMELLQALQAQNDKLLEEITGMKGQLTALDGKYQAILTGLADNKKDLEALK